MPEAPGRPSGQPLADAAQALVEAWDAHDADRVAAWLHPEARALWLGRPPIEGRAAIEAALRDAFDSPAFTTRTELLDIVELAPGRAGYTLMAYRAGTTRAGTHGGKAVAVWAREPDDPWQVRVHSSSPDEPLTAPG